MANAQVGNRSGVVSIGSTPVAEITADGANTVTVDDPQKIRVGASIDIVNKSTGAVLASNRQITDLTSAGVLTYSGANVDATPGTHAIYPTGEFDTNPTINGGAGLRSGFQLERITTISGLRNRLKTYNSTTYSDAELDKMTENDMIYAVRVIDFPATVK